MDGISDVGLDHLESFLQETPPSPLVQPTEDDTYDEEYKRFLAKLLAGELDEEDVNDADYIYLEDDSLHNPQQFDSEEYRNDRAVHVSKEEVAALTEETIA